MTIEQQERVLLDQLADALTANKPASIAMARKVLTAFYRSIGMHP